MDAPPPQPSANPAFDLATYRARSTGELYRDALASADDAEDRMPADPSRGELILALLQRDWAGDPGVTGRGDGILDLRPEGFGFLRAAPHLGQADRDDIFVSANQVRRLRLRAGQLLTGALRLPRNEENYLAMVRVDSIDGLTVAEWQSEGRVPFRFLTPVLPHRRLHLSTAGTCQTLRAIDLLAPLGAGQRVLVRAPHGLRRAPILLDIAAAITGRAPAVEVVAALVDQAPETLAETIRRLAGRPRTTLLASTFADPPERHLEVLRSGSARAQRLVETGRDAVLLVDSLTHGIRAAHAALPHSGKVLRAGLDTAALHRGLEVFSLARQTEEGPSLTVIATLVDGEGAGLDAAIAEEFAGRADVEIGLAVAENGPTIDLWRTGIRGEGCVLEGDERAAYHRFWNSLREEQPAAARQRLESDLADTADNAALLARWR